MLLGNAELMSSWPVRSDATYTMKPKGSVWGGEESIFGNASRVTSGPANQLSVRGSREGVAVCLGWMFTRARARPRWATTPQFLV